ncbi:uncharacterized protein PRCAT00002362001 [Priceomyces carsonii]|uniref:uncharacterized protein n=1 Tax=Priceomyces carsonii TaxID=28549 RepID=UPI002ED77A57|nr:unnamed protein product [Priceomyces carsonii]
MMEVPIISPSVRKVFVLLSCTFLGLICGTLYLYSSYSPQFAKQLNYTATDASRIALMGTIGIAVSGPLAGLVVDKKGYSVSLVIGGLLIVVGYLAMKKQFDHIYSNVSLSATCIFFVGCGSTFINLACLKCCAVSFPSIRGVATSLPLALYGLSALFFSVIASVFFPGDTSMFLGFLAYSTVVIFVICAPSVIVCDWEHKLRKTVQNKHMSLDSIELSTMRPSMSRTPLLNLSPRTSVRNRPFGVPDVDISGTHLARSWKFWGIFIITGSLAALGQMYIYSVGYMVKALVTNLLLKEIEHSDGALTKIEQLIQKDQQLQVGLLSIANCVGRISSGVLGDVVQSFNKPRSLLLYVPCIGMMVAQVMSLLINEYGGLSADSLLTGFSYGFTFCIMPIIVGDSFGMENFSSNWGIVGLAPIFPSFFFTSLFGQIYDSHTEPYSNSRFKLCVLGNLCYSAIFKLTIVITIFTLLIISVLNFGNLIVKRSKYSEHRKLSL